MSTMRAAVIYHPGGPEVLTLENRPIPTPQPGQVLIQIKAFGLNRSELFIRQGNSPSVSLPRILGIECTGIVSSCPGNDLPEGAIVATAMSGLGTDFDGGYAEYTVVPITNVQVVKWDGEVDWRFLGALPEMLQMAWGALFKSLSVKKGERLLIRGGTTSLGLAAATIAKNCGVYVAGTTRKREDESEVRVSGADEVVLDDGRISEKIGEGEKFDKVLELVGMTTLEDSLRCVKSGGCVCMIGIVGNQWDLERFSPVCAIPTAVSLTTYSGEAEDFMATPFEELVEQIKGGVLKILKVFKLEEIVEAHRCMEENWADGKIVVLT